MYEWLHPVSDIVNALMKAGLTIDFLNEHEILVWRHYPGMIETGEDQFEQARDCRAFHCRSRSGRRRCAGANSGHARVR